MDYRTLLKKYIQHVGLEEGCTFLMGQGGWDDSVKFTDEEWTELKTLEKEPSDVQRILVGYLWKPEDREWVQIIPEEIAFIYFESEPMKLIPNKENNE